MHVEYDPAFVDDFIALADAVEAAFPNVIVEGNENEDGRQGSFEIQTSDGINIYSMLHSKALPDTEDVVMRIVNRTRLQQGPSADGPKCS